MSGELGALAKVHDIEAGDDGDALAEAKALKLPTECKLWERGRLVAELDPQKSSPAMLICGDDTTAVQFE